jgi:hypothetical protein
MKEKTMDIQAFFNAISAAARDTRGDYHVTLGKMIDAIKDMPPETPVVYDVGGAPGRPHSYRGYYSDLSFSPADSATVESLLKHCRGSLDATFEGYKGGEFVMGADTPLWFAEYGCCGRAIVDMREEMGRLVLVTKADD